MIPSNPGIPPHLLTIYQHRAMTGLDRYYCDAQVPNGSGWGDGVPLFRAYASPQPGTVAVYRHQTTFGIDRYYYDRQVPNAYGWKDGEVLCYAYYTEQPGTIPIYIHHAGNPDRYYLDTQVPNNYGWSAGSLLCYAYPVDHSLIDDITGILGWQGARYKETTYLDTSDNTFTLLDTPRLWNETGTVPQPIPACLEMMNEIANTIGSAQRVVDITMLWQTGKGLPRGGAEGGFQRAIHNGFKTLVKTGRKPLFRIMIGVPIGPIILSGDLQQWLKETIEMDNALQVANIPFTVQIACCKQSPQSWNHAKVVAADGILAIAGGHNLWNDYLGTTPVHDVSGKIEGSVVGAIHNFCDDLWKKPSVMPHFVVLDGGRFKHQQAPFTRGAFSGNPLTGKGSTRMLALGRLGFGLCDELTVTSNASVSARIIAFCRAKKYIRLSQQSLYFSITGLDGGFDFYTLWALVKALRDGVKVDIVLSNEVPLADGGYEGNIKKVVEALALLYAADKLGLYHTPVNLTRDNLDGWASASLKPLFPAVPATLMSTLINADCTKAVQELNERLRVAPLYYARDRNYWQVGNKQHLAANHAKVYIIDDEAFYVGSDNLYLSGSPHGLQEFGFLVQGKTETANLIKNYWDRLWAHSQEHVLKASIVHSDAPINPYGPVRM